jgi:energy-coupling factor transport system substrate-specific component
MGINDYGKNRMNVRDYITAAIMLVLTFIVYVAVGAPIGMTVVGVLFVFAACAVVWGTIFMLLYTKVNKKGIVLLVGLILAALQLMNFWGVSLFIALGAILSEFIWRKSNRRQFSTMLLCFTTQITFWYLGLTIPLIFLKDLYLAALPGYEALYSGVFNLVLGPMFFVGLFSTIAGCTVGAFLGKLLLKKHFLKAGIV